MDIATREQFVEYWNRVQPGLGDATSPIWSYEEYRGIRCLYFIAVDPITDRPNWNQQEFWAWCDENLQAQCLCYSSDPGKLEWWGFEKQEDITIWILQWATESGV